MDSVNFTEVQERKF